MTELTLNHVVDDVDLAGLLDSNFKTHEELVCIKRRKYCDLQKSLDEKAHALPKEFMYKCIARNELGCAELLCKVAKGEVVYDRPNGQWYWWNGLHWEADRGGNIPGLTGDILSSAFRHTAAQKYEQFLELKSTIKDRKPTDEEKKELDTLKSQQQSAEAQMRDLYKLSYIRNILIFAGASELLGLIGDEWDAQPHLLGVNNAVIDLNTGKPVRPDPAHYIRTIAPVDYDAKATCPIWEKSILQIFNNDAGMVAYIRRFLGYAMSGTCYESDFHVWYGKDGRNGKEFILERINSVLGNKLTTVVRPELLLKSRNQSADDATPALMVLQGARLAWASETNEGRHIDNAAMKDLSGGHILTGRHLHREEVKWRRTHTIVLITNHKPHVTGGGGAEWERIKLVNFTESFVDNPDPNNPHQHKKDPTLGEKIDAGELPGLLNWLIAGCLEWRKHGLQTPAAVNDATAKYKENEDTLGRFIEECCIIFSGAQIMTSELYEEYKRWCGDGAMGRKTFSTKIAERGFTQNREAKGMFFYGIGVGSDPTLQQRWKEQQAAKVAEAAGV